MIEAELNARGEDVRDGLAHGWLEAFVNDVAAEGQGKAVVLPTPPDAEVFADLQTFILIRELAFVDDEADVGLAGAHGLEDLVEGHDDVIEVLRGLAEPELECEEGAGHGAGDGDLLAEDFFLRETLLADEHRAVAIAHARAAGEQGILVANVGVGVDADGGDVEFAAGGALVQGLDILEDMFELKAVGRNEPLRQPVEHEGIIGVGRMAKSQGALRHVATIKRQRRACHGKGCRAAGRSGILTALVPAAGGFVRGGWRRWGAIPWLRPLRGASG